MGSIGASVSELQDEETAREKLSDARALGEQLVGAVDEDRQCPSQRQEINEFRNRMRNLVMMHGEEWEYEYRIWMDRED